MWASYEYHKHGNVKTISVTEMDERKRTNDELVSCDSEHGPPFKKARFRWQIKGKRKVSKQSDRSHYHKNEKIHCHTNTLGHPVPALTIDRGLAVALNGTDVEICKSVSSHTVVSVLKDCNQPTTLCTDAQNGHSNNTVEKKEVREAEACGSVKSGGYDTGSISSTSSPGDQDEHGTVLNTYQENVYKHGQRTNKEHKDMVEEALYESDNVQRAQYRNGTNKSSINVESESDSCMHVASKDEGANKSKPSSHLPHPFVDMHQTTCVDRRENSSDSKADLQTYAFTDSTDVDSHGNSISDPGQTTVGQSSSDLLTMIRSKVDVQTRELNIMELVQKSKVPEEQGAGGSSSISHSGICQSSSDTDHDPNCHRTESDQHNNSCRLPQCEDCRPVSESLSPSQTERSGQGRLSYLARWQSQHTAKAIVDNAINKTLEEMGLTPDPDVNHFIWDRLWVEDEGINQAIQMQGLLPQQQDNNPLQHRLQPIISQLTQASELVFAQSIENMERPVPPGRSETIPESVGQDKDNTQEIHPVSLVDTKTSDVDSDIDLPFANSDHADGIDCTSVLHYSAPADADDVLQFAVNAVITSRGLTVRNDG